MPVSRSLCTNYLQPCFSQVLDQLIRLLATAQVSQQTVFLATSLIRKSAQRNSLLHILFIWSVSILYYNVMVTPEWSFTAISF